ncbi:hypothetical protein ACTMTJ_18630 [Phytohabitans sp. LJ34]|uniref:hypothetical protein n=1 Tax=Phytohabitans sp. LJ34 TaxID=3452217 RepID=UPI003F8A3DE9
MTLTAAGISRSARHRARRQGSIATRRTVPRPVRVAPAAERVDAPRPGAVARLIAQVLRPDTPSQWLALAILSPLLVPWLIVVRMKQDLDQVRADIRRDREQMRRRAYGHLMRRGRDAQVAWQQFVWLNGVTPADPLLASRFRRHCFRALRLERADERHMAMISVPGGLLFMGLPVVLQAPIHMDPASHVLLYLAVLAGVMATFYLFTRLTRFASWVRAGVVIVAVFVGASLLLRTRWHVRWPTSTPGQRLPGEDAGAVLWCGIVAATVAAFLILMVALQALVEWPREVRLMRREPDVVAFRAVRRVIGLLARPERTFADLVTRRRLVWGLEQLARTIERGYPRAIVPAAAADRDALAAKCAQLARTIRTYQVSLAFPDVETLPALRRMTLATTSAICTGRLGSLALSPSPVAGARRRLWSTVGAALRVLLVAALPVLAATVLLRFGLLGGDSTSRTIVVAATLWGVVVLMTALDPLFNDRVSTMKDLLGMLSTNKKE